MVGGDENPENEAAVYEKGNAHTHIQNTVNKHLKILTWNIAGLNK